MADVNVMKIDLGRINAATTDMGASLSDVADDITQLIALVKAGDATKFDEVANGLSDAATTIEGFAQALKATAAAYPEVA